jgi:hypothetical protein
VQLPDNVEGLPIPRGYDCRIAFVVRLSYMETVLENTLGSDKFLKIIENNHPKVVKVNGNRIRRGGFGRPTPDLKSGSLGKKLLRTFGKNYKRVAAYRHDCQYQL